jgi:hypothetical protein
LAGPEASNEKEVSMARLLLLFLLLPLAASAADEGRISFLEQEVRNLQRQVQALSRQMDELRTRPARLEAKPSSSVTAPASAAGLPRWVDASRWRGIRSGMSELEVISSLGPPNSTREENGLNVLFYALEIGPSEFLGGSVKLREHSVVEVVRPTLQ